MLFRSVSPTLFALGCGARFVARGVDTNQKHLPEVFKRAHAHVGASFVEVFQNCIVYNDGVYDYFTEKDAAADNQVVCEHGKPLLFGKDKKKGLRLKPGTFELEAVTIGENGVSEKDVLVHDETNKMLATLLAGMQPPALPMAIGVLYCNPGPTYESGVQTQVDEAKTATPKPSMNALLRRGPTWTID